MEDQYGHEDSAGNKIPDEFETRLRQDYQRYDERWSGSNQLRDWLIILGIGLFVFIWEVIVILVEPGIR